MKNKTEKQYVYIVQAAKETAYCKIGKTNDLERRLKEYNSMTGKSKENNYQYLFACEVKNMTQIEKDIKAKFTSHRPEKSREMYFFSTPFLKDYVDFIKSHNLFIKETFIKTDEKPKVKEIIVPRTTPTLKERGLTPKGRMQQSKRRKDDEFYTRYEDVEKEISMYDKEIWKNKVVFCNCDDAIDLDDEKRSSAFSWYFYKNFKELGLKKLICTHYAGQVDLFEAGAKAYVAYVSITTDGENLYKEYPKNFSGSFDDPYSLKILNEEADIVCTNPPWSKCIDYWKIVIKSGKKFIILSNITNAQNTAYIHYFKNNQVWAGYNEVDLFQNPDRGLKRAAGFWYTNIPIENRPRYKQLKIMPLKNIPEKYKRYDDSKTLLVENNYIPSNIKKPFAVPARAILNGILEKGYKIVQEKRYEPYFNGKESFSKVLIQKI